MRFSTVSDGRVMAIIIIEEILMANGLAVLMAGYLCTADERTEKAFIRKIKYMMELH